VCRSGELASLFWSVGSSKSIVFVPICLRKEVMRAKSSAAMSGKY